MSNENVVQSLAQIFISQCRKNKVSLFVTSCMGQDTIVLDAKLVTFIHMTLFIYKKSLSVI